MDESDSDATAPQLHRPGFAPAIRVSSDTEGSLADGNEPSTSAGLKGRRRKMSWVVQPQELAIYDVASGTYTGPSPPMSRSTRSSGSARSTSVGRQEESTTTTTTTDAAPLLEKTMPVLVDYLENIDSLGSGGFRLDTARRKDLKWIDETPRGIPDTARSSYIPPHLLNLSRTGLIKAQVVRVDSLHVTDHTDHRRKYSSTFSDISSMNTSRSLERGQQIQEKLHNLVHAFHERARQVKEQVVVQPPSPTLSPSEDSKPFPKLSIPLHQMPIQQQTPPRGSSSEIPGEDRMIHLWGYDIELPPWCPRPRLPKTMEPQSEVYISWLFIISLAFMYNAYAIPLRAAFPFQTPENLKWWFLADYSCDVLYLIDIVFFKTSVRYVSNGAWVDQRRDIVRRYMHSWRFRLDLLASLPLDIFFLIPQVGVNSLLRLPKLLKIPSYWESHSRLDQVARSPHVLRVLNSVAYMMWMIHTNACLFYYISKVEGFGSNHWTYNEKHPAYLHSFWRSFIVATAVGNAPEPENIIENSYMIFSWLTGVFVFALLIGQIRDIFTQMTYQEDHYQKTVDTAIRYLQNSRIPKEIQRRVRDWYTYNWEQHKTLDENSLLDGLPRKLKTDLVLSVHYNTLAKVQLFHGTDQSLLRDLVLKLKPVVFLPMEYICKKGEVGKDMFIVRSGYLDVVTSDGQVVSTLSEGSVFGEISLLSLTGGNRRTADVRSRGYSNLYVLSKKDLHEVLRDYPETQEMLKKKAQKFYRSITPTTEKKQLEVEVITSRSTTPEFVRTVLNVMAPESAMRQRLSQGSIVRNDFPPALTEPSDSDDSTDLSFPDSEVEKRHTTRPTNLLNVALNMNLQVTDETNTIRRSVSSEMLRRRRELQLKRASSSDIDSNQESPSGPLASFRRRRSRTPNKMIETVERENSPAPIAGGESDEVAEHTPRRLFFPAFLLEPLRKLFSRPAKVKPVVMMNDRPSEVSEAYEMPARSSRSARQTRSQVFRLPSASTSSVVGSEAPSFRSVSELNYDSLDLNPPNLEKSSSAELYQPVWTVRQT